MRNESSRYLSPLRYPGGKGLLDRFVVRLMYQQPRRPKRYVEPFAGGAGVALSLLYDEHVDEVVLNDLDPGVAAFWRASFEHPDDLISLIHSCQLTIDEWHAQHERYESKTGGDVELGFAAFFLNRTNRSGILGARPIGGLEQRGRWGIAARFNRESLTTRIRRLARYASRVTVCEEDGIELTRDYLKDDRSFVYADPPYLTRGQGLYLNTLRWEDHMRLAGYLRDATGGWLLTYDDDERVPSELYPGLRCASFEIAHTAAIQRVGREFAVFADHLIIDSLNGLGRKAAFV